MELSPIIRKKIEYIASLLSTRVCPGFTKSTRLFMKMARRKERMPTAANGATKPRKWQRKAAMKRPDIFPITKINILWLD
jgi:hypothetical protein